MHEGDYGPYEVSESRLPNAEDLYQVIASQEQPSPVA